MSDDMFFDEEIDSGYECIFGHPLRLVAEGYALCHDNWSAWAWRMTPPLLMNDGWMRCATTRGGIPDEHRWISNQFSSREAALNYIRRDIEAYRNLPFDEEAERQRLTPV